MKKDGPQVKKARKSATATGPKPVSSVEEFCRDHGFSKTLFYQLEKDGKAPRSMKIGRRRLITSEASAEWRKAMEDATAAGAA